MSKPDAPDPPDYRAAAIEQGQANLEAGKQTSVLSNPNIVTPYGSQQVTYGQNVMGVQQPTVTQTFSPEQQALYDQQNLLSQNLNDTAIQGLGRVNQMMGQGFDTSDFVTIPGLDFSTLPGVNAYNSGGFQDVARYNNAGFLDVARYDNSGFRDMSAVDLAQLDPRTVQGSVGGLQMIADALRAREADRFADARSQSEADLLARGFNPGGRGYDRRMDELGRQQNDFNLAATLAAGQEQSRLFGLESQARAQGLAEQLARSQTDMGIRGQQSAEEIARLQGDLGIRGQQASEEAMRLQGDLGIRGQQAAEEQARKNAELQARQLFANERLTEQQAAADIRARQIQEALFSRQLPLNEINALRTGNQAMLPQFQQFSGAGVAAAPMYGAAQDQFAANQANYQNELGAYNNMMGGLFSLGGAALGAGAAAGGFGNLFSFQ